MDIVKPIMIIGVGRSGSTIFHQILAEHPQLAWISGLCSRFPGNPSIMRRVLKAADYPIIGATVRKTIYPGEAYDLWEYHCKGFSEPCRDLGPDDVSQPVKKRLHDYFSRILTPERHRLLIKITGWARIGFLREVFDDAKFIHILRDGRSVAHSLMNVKWWGGWKGPQNWRWGELTPAQMEEWKRYDKSFFALAAIEWNILTEAVQNAKRYVPSDDLLEIKYEDLCDDPVGMYRRVVGFCDLDWSASFEAAINNHTLRNTNCKRTRDLTARQQQILDEVTRKQREVLGYV